MGFFDKLFKKPNKIFTRAEMLSGATAVYTAWSGDAYANDIYREAIDAIARNIGKLKGSHIIRYNDIKKEGADYKLNRILQVQPNPFMSAYDMLYKLATHYYLYNNAFAYINKDERGRVANIYPINCTQVTFIVDSVERLYCQFYLRSGKQIILPYDNLIHLRRNYNSDELLGDSNSALIPALELAHTQNEGIINGIKTSATIRGILKYTSIMSPEKLKESKEAFINDYLDVSNTGGVIATDQKMEYEPITVNPQNIDAEQIKATQTKIYNYLGITEKIVNSSYNEDEWGAFYESVIEPLAIQLSLEFTRKIFNERELAFGNSIIFDSGRVIYSSNKTKLDLIDKLLPMGCLSINQALEILNLPPIEGGDKRIQSLNYANTDIVDKYQLQDSEEVTEKDKQVNKETSKQINKEVIEEGATV